MMKSSNTIVGKEVIKEEMAKEEVIDKTNVKATTRIRLQEDGLAACLSSGHDSIKLLSVGQLMS